MGREATCHCKWGDEEGDCKVLLEGVDGSESNLALICASSRSELDHALAQCFKEKTWSGPLWIVYPKGPASEVKASAVRDLCASRGFTDTKIASVSAKLTATRFNKRKE